MSEALGLSTAIALRSVPWVVGTVVKAAPAAELKPVDLAMRAQRKAAQIEETIRWLQGLVNARAKKPTMDRRRDTLEGIIAGQRRRLQWLALWTTATPAQRAARRVAIQTDLGPEGLAFASNGLPRERASDQRFVDLLSELAILGLCSRAREVTHAEV